MVIYLFFLFFLDENISMVYVSCLVPVFCFPFLVSLSTFSHFFFLSLFCLYYFFSSLTSFSYSSPFNPRLLLHFSRASPLSHISSAGFYCQPGAKVAREASCTAGFYCPAGSSLATGSGMCTAGFYCPIGASSATQAPCLAGYYCAAGSVVATGTGQCAIGNYCPASSSSPIGNGTWYARLSWARVCNMSYFDIILHCILLFSIVDSIPFICHDSSLSLFLFFLFFLFLSRSIILFLLASLPILSLFSSLSFGPLSTLSAL
jgi:hypothetical protein